MWRDIAVEALAVFPFLLSAFVFGFAAFCVGLALTYALGRMFGLLESDRSKNFVALVGMIAASWWAVDLYTLVPDWEMFIWRFALVLSVAVLAYVLLGFRLYYRIDAWQSRKLGPGDRPKKRTRRSK